MGLDSDHDVQFYPLSQASMSLLVPVVPGVAAAGAESCRVGGEDGFDGSQREAAFGDE